MSTSQNGWPANDRSVIVKTYVPGTQRYITTRKGDVSRIFAYLLGRLHREVEPIDGGVYDDWGYAERSVRGSSTSLSNHASGTGIDVNATRHPLGAVNTFDPVKEQRIRAILKDCRGAIRWGGDYKNRKDEMHFEIVVTPNRLAQIVSEMGLRGGTFGPQPSKPVQGAPVRPAPNAWPGHVYAKGQEGPDTYVKKFQTRLNDLAYHLGDADGEFGTLTERAVLQFQLKNSLAKSGKVDQNTWDKLFASNAVRNDAPVPEFNFGPAYPGALLKRGSRGPAVGAYQAMMKKRGWNGMVVDNHFGPTTHRLTVQFQQDKGLKANGIVGPDTWNAARSSSNK